VELENDGSSLTARVRDNGAGLPEGFEIDRSVSLGLSIARNLVRTQLDGTIDMRNWRNNGEAGTLVELRVPTLPAGATCLTLYEPPPRGGART